MVYQGWLLSHVVFSSNGENLIEVATDTLIEVKTLQDGSLVAVYNNMTFDICDDEYVKLIGTPSKATH